MSSTKGKLLQYIFFHFKIVFHNEDSTVKIYYDSLYVALFFCLNMEKNITDEPCCIQLCNFLCILTSCYAKSR